MGTDRKGLGYGDDQRRGTGGRGVGRSGVAGIKPR
ncbi:hypothetical protein SDC9_156047 [bioreactor metagenome]|uniref:Uncharacterized protein n=1 Tax=bioreactor metagenome TaxID=1076179 RepID=A0A645F5G5_9ZZZZ